MAELDEATRQEQRKKAGDYLKMADKLFKGGDLNGATRLVQMAMAVDPQNPYVNAYAERLKIAASQKASQSLDAPPTPAPPAPSGRSSGTAPVTASGTRPPGEKPAAPPPTPLTASQQRSIPPDAHGRALEQEMRRNAEVEARKMAHDDQVRKSVEDEYRPKLEEAVRVIEDYRRRLEEEKRRRTELETEYRELSTAREGQFQEELDQRIDSEQKRLEAEFAARLRVEKAAVEEVTGKRKAQEERSRALEESRRIIEAEKIRIQREMETRLTEERAQLQNLRVQEEAALAERRKTAELQLRQLQEDLHRKMQEELSATRDRLEEDARRQLAAEHRRLEETRARESAEAKEAHRHFEEETRRRMEEELAKRLAKERANLEAETRRQLDIERVRIEEDAYRRAEEAGKAQRDEQERVAAELRAKAEEERRRKEEEQERQLRSEAEETRRYEEAVRQAIDEGRRVAQAKTVRGYLDQAAIALENQRFDEALQDITRALRLEPSNPEGQELEKRVYAVRDETSRQKEQQERRTEQRRRLEELQRRLEEQTKRDAEEQKARAIREAKLAALLRRTKELQRSGQFEAALKELNNLYQIDPGSPAGREIEIGIIATQQSRVDAEAISARRSAESETWRREEEGRELERQADRERLKQDAFESYRSMLKQSWVNGIPASDERAMIEVIRLSLGISDEDRDSLEKEIRAECYADAFRSAQRNGIVVADDEHALAPLRQVFDLQTDEARQIEADVLRETETRTSSAVE